MATAPARVRQFFDHLHPGHRQPPGLPGDVRVHLNAAMLAHFRRLTPGDQRHLIAVYRALRAAGAEEATCVAGLLHDVGKAGRVTTRDRIAKVLLRGSFPGWWSTFAQRPTAPRLLRGLHLAARHAERGADLAIACGYGERVAWLIRHHEDDDDSRDGQLALLIAADDAADSSSSHYT